MEKIYNRKNIPNISKMLRYWLLSYTLCEVISNYESNPLDEDGYIVLGYYKPKASFVSGGEQNSFEDTKLNACFPKNCETLLQEILARIFSFFSRIQKKAQMLISASTSVFRFKTHYGQYDYQLNY